MKIAYIVTRSDTIGGSHIHVRDLCSKMRDKGHQAMIFVGGKGPFTENLKSRNIPYYPLSVLQRSIHPVKDFKALFELRSILKRYNPDIISTHSSKAGFLGRIAARTLNIPVIFTAHGWSFTDGVKRATLYKWAEKAVSPFSDKIITVSIYDKEIALKNGVATEKKLLPIHNGMPSKVNGSSSSLEKDKMVHLAMTARFDDQKDHDSLIEACRNIKNIHLDLIGDGPDIDRIKVKVVECGMDHRVTFWGLIDNVEEVLANADIFALISNWEGFPRSTLEAMRAGLPCIVSDVGGSKEAIVEGETGFVVPKGDVESIKKRVHSLVEDAEIRREMGEAAHKHFQNNFTFEIMFEKTYKVYEEVLNKA